MTADGRDDGGDELTDTGSLEGAATAIDDRASADARPVAVAVGRARWGVFVTIAVAVVVLDQVSKAWLVSSVAPGEVVRLVGDYVRLVFSHNSGALFGLFRDQALLFGIVSLGVVGLILAYHGRSGRNVYLSITLGLLLGGAIGNLIDRFRLGYVVDWVDIGLGDIRFWTFNVADAAVSTAIVLLIGLALFPSLAARLGAGTDA
jgi:signal peptidase II